MSLAPLGSCSLSICNLHLALRTCWLVLFFISQRVGLLPKQAASLLTTALYCLPRCLVHNHRESSISSCWGSNDTSNTRNSCYYDCAKHFICFISFNLPAREVAQSVPTPCDPMDYIAYQVPLSMGFSRQEYWSGLPFPSPRDLPYPGFEPNLPHCGQMLYHLSQQGSPARVAILIIYHYPQLGSKAAETQIACFCS